MRISCNNPVRLMVSTSQDSISTGQFICSWHIEIFYLTYQHFLCYGLGKIKFSKRSSMSDDFGFT